jgi:curved DNA-binding protein CbpA
LPPHATQTNIRKNYLKLAKIYHPDVYKGSDKNRFQKIQTAYKTLSNLVEKRKYDQNTGFKTDF